MAGRCRGPISASSPSPLRTFPHRDGSSGALQADLAIDTSLGFIAVVFLAKCAASIVSLGFGVRCGLFFAPLFFGTLVDHLFSGGLGWAAGSPVIDPHNAALVGMSALAVAIVGGAMTMAMRVRGETIKSAHDVGWVKTLTAGRMMRRETRATPAGITAAAYSAGVDIGAVIGSLAINKKGHCRRR